MGGELLMAAIAAASGVAGPGCVRVVTAVSAGDFATIADLAPADCQAPADAAFRYDRVAHAVRALRDLRVGEIVVAPASSSLAGIRPGQPLTIEAHVGPVVVQRRVEAVQAAMPGARLFVKAADGEAFAVPFPEKGE